MNVKYDLRVNTTVVSDGGARGKPHSWSQLVIKFWKWQGVGHELFLVK